MIYIIFISYLLISYGIVTFMNYYIEQQKDKTTVVEKITLFAAWPLLFLVGGMTEIFSNIDYLIKRIIK